MAQSVGIFFDAWLGFALALKLAIWQLLHEGEVPAKPFAWHLIHSVVVWAPVSGKGEVAWLNTPSEDPEGWHAKQAGSLEE